LRAAALATVAVLVSMSGAAAQAPERDLAQAMAGPWEIADPTRIEGFFLETVPSPMMRLYWRTPGGVDVGPGGQGGSWVIPELQHTRLRAAGIELDFDVARRAWTGNFYAGGSPGPLSLRRPEPARGVPGSPFVGDWTSERDRNERFPHRAGQLHVAESADERLTCWMDSWEDDPRLGTIFQRIGEPLVVLSSTRNSLVLGTSNVTGVPYTWAGKLSADGQHLEGDWTSPVAGAGGPFSSAPALFTRDVPGRK
jgi:hypothetical protein